MLNELRRSAPFAPCARKYACVYKKRMPLHPFFVFRPPVRPGGIFRPQGACRVPRANHSNTFCKKIVIYLKFLTQFT